MISLSKALSTPKAKALVPGIYRSVVLSVAYAADYVHESALEIKYELTAADGSTHPYREIFFNDSSIPRTRAFLEYLDSLGVPMNELEQFVGFEEELVIKKAGKGKLVTIESRRAL